MAKVWKDIDEVVKMIHELPNEKLKVYDEEMKKKPGFDKRKDKKRFKKKYKKRVD